MRTDFFKQFKWQDQPGGLDGKTIGLGFTKAKQVFNDIDDTQKLSSLREIAEKQKSFHAAYLYCNTSLMQLSPESPSFVSDFNAIKSWYSTIAAIHGSPTFYHLASICGNYAQMELKGMSNKNLLIEALGYIQAGLALKEMSQAALANAFCENIFSPWGLSFGTLTDLQQFCENSLKKIGDIPHAEIAKKKEDLIDQYLKQIRTHAANNTDMHGL